MVKYGFEIFYFSKNILRILFALIEYSIRILYWMVYKFDIKAKNWKLISNRNFCSLAEIIIPLLS